MIDAVDFEDILHRVKTEDGNREQIIKKSRDVQRWSKQAIFSLHRKDYQQAARNLEQSLHTVNDIQPLINTHPQLRTGAFASAMEEYAEARTLEFYLQKGTLLPLKDIPFVTIDEYLGGILDFSGELLRYAILRATDRDMVAVNKARDLVQEMMGVFLQFDFRNGSLRRKFDGLKYTLKKLENTLYELSLAKTHVVADAMERVPTTELSGDEL